MNTIQKLKKNLRISLFVPLVVLISLSLACRLPELLMDGAETPEPVPGLGESGDAFEQPTVAPSPAPESCLAGTWEISGIHEYVLAAIPQEMAEEYNLEYKDTNGNAYFILTPDGQALLQADGLEIVFEAKAGIFSVPVTALVDGMAVGRYSAQGGILTTTGMDTSGLSASAQAMGQELAAPEQILRAIPLLKPPANRAEYTCEGDTLRLKIGAYPAGVPALEFTRK